MNFKVNNEFMDGHDMVEVTPQRGMDRMRYVCCFSVEVISLVYERNQSNQII